MKPAMKPAMNPAAIFQKLGDRLPGYACALFLLSSCPVISLGDPPPAQPTPPTAADSNIALHANQLHGDEITPDQEAAVSRGLAWLVARQAPDG